MPNKTRTLDVLYQCDNNYAVLTGVSIISLLENNKHLDSITIHFLDDGLSKENLDHYRQIAKKYNRAINIIDTRALKEEFIKLKVTPYKGTYTTYFKLKVLKDLPIKSDRILYLDGDVLVDGKLDELIEMNLEGSIMGCVHELVLSEYKKMIGLSKKDRYFNCGVMLVNQKEWKKQECEEKIIDHLLTERNTYFIVDQDILNVLFREHIKPIAPTYNFNPGFYLYGYDNAKKMYGFQESDQFNREVIERALKDGPILSHCMGSFTGRPWEQDNIHPMNNLYDKYRAISPWAKTPKVSRKMKSLFKLQKILYKLLPKSLYVYIHKGTLYFFYRINSLTAK